MLYYVRKFTERRAPFAAAKNFMSYDLEYFREFLEDPSVPPIAEFYEMVNKWGTYLIEHNGEFNYLEDDEWKEIRERLIKEFAKREAVKHEINDEWEALLEAVGDYNKLSDEEAIAYGKRKLEFIKTHKDLYSFPDEEIKRLEEALISLEESYHKDLDAQEQLRISDLKLEESLANLDKEMLRIYERTGKFPRVQFYSGVKKNKGN